MPLKRAIQNAACAISMRMKQAGTASIHNGGPSFFVSHFKVI